ncbi:phage antirepressor [Pseudomonas sp. CrR25]|nr:phage antirepressor [Pseudomonas sp. CrR25]
MHDEVLIPTLFTRHRRQLRAMLLDGQPWFVARDLGRLLNHRIEDGLRRSLDDDQLQSARLRTGDGGHEKALLISESGAYIALLHYYHPENRCLRRWLTHEVIPLLRDQYQTCNAVPRRSLLRWQALELDVLHWQGQLWVPYGALPHLTTAQPPSASA